MSNVLGEVLSFVLLYRYLAIAVVVYASAVIVPLPANAMLLAVGAFASQGYFNFWAVLAVAVGANTAGDLTDYAIARAFGGRVVRALHLHRFVFYEELQSELRTDAAVTVFTTRFAGALSTVANFLAGLVRVRFTTFFINDVLGNAIEPFGALAIGFAAGNYWSNLSEPIEIVAGMVAVAIVMFVLYRIYRRVARRR